MSIRKNITDSCGDENIFFGDVLLLKTEDTIKVFFQI